MHIAPFADVGGADDDEINGTPTSPSASRRRTNSSRRLSNLGSTTRNRGRYGDRRLLGHESQTGSREHRFRQRLPSVSQLPELRTRQPSADKVARSAAIRARQNPVTRSASQLIEDAFVGPRAARSGELGNPRPPPVKTNFYVDAFNLYYGALKGTPYKWLDLAALFGRVFPKNETHRIRYVTARVDRQPPHFQQHQQQQAYLRALFAPVLRDSRGEIRKPKYW
jgi:hypothetical protein